MFLRKKAIIFLTITVANMLNAQAYADTNKLSAESPSDTTSVAPKQFKRNLPRLADIVGPVPKEILELIAYLKSLHGNNTTQNQNMRADLNETSMLLYGPPGTGKTSLAQLIAAESGAEFFELPGNSLYNNYLGTGSMRIDAVFDAAIACGKPAVIFCDEIDGLCYNPNSLDQNVDVKTAFNRFNMRLEECNTACDKRIFFIGATNEYELLKGSSLDRFGITLHIPLPDENQRCRLLMFFMKKYGLKLCPSRVYELALQMKDFSNRDIIRYIRKVKDIRGNYVMPQYQAALDTMLQNDPKFNKKIIEDNDKRRSIWTTLGDITRFGYNALTIGSILFNLYGTKTMDLGKLKTQPLERN